MLALLALVGALLRRDRAVEVPSVARAIDLVAKKAEVHGRPDECRTDAFKDVPYCRTWPSLPVGMPGYCKQMFMYTVDDVTKKATEPAECVTYERPSACDMHSFCHHCMVYKPEYGLLDAQTQGASFDACSSCVLENCCSYYAEFGCRSECNDAVSNYGAGGEAICANNALEHLPSSPLKRMLTKKSNHMYKAEGYA